MPKLTSDQKIFIVQALATFRMSTEIIADFKAEFNADIQRQHVRFYDPTKLPINKKLPQKYIEIFWATREAWLKETANVGVFNQRYRGERIQESLERQLTNPKKNEPLILQTLEQAAKESGGLYTNKREIMGKNGGPIEQKHSLDLKGLSDEELIFLERIAGKSTRS